MSSIPNTAHPTTTARGVRGWLAMLSTRDKLIYGALLSVMLLILGIYMALAVDFLAGATATTPTTPTTSAETELFVATIIATPTSTATANPTLTPTPTDIPTPTASATARPTPSTTPSATSAPLLQDVVTLYFTDASNTLLVPVSRPIAFNASYPAVFEPSDPDNLVSVVIRELLNGPQPGSQLNTPFTADIRLLDLQQTDDSTIVNLSAQPNDQALEALALTLTELSDVQRVQVQVQGTPVAFNGDSAPVGRRPYNLDNPSGLSTELDSGTRFLPLYFRLDDRWVRVNRLVPRTQAVARTTLMELFAGPGQYGNLLSSPIPGGTALLNIRLDPNDAQRIEVDLNSTFATATNREAALQAIIFSLTDLRNANNELLERVTVQVNGQPLSTFWGAAYDQPFFERPSLNPEGTP